MMESGEGEFCYHCGLKLVNETFDQHEKNVHPIERVFCRTLMFMGVVIILTMIGCEVLAAIFILGCL